MFVKTVKYLSNVTEFQKKKCLGIRGDPGMRKKVLEEAIEKTQRCVVSYWNGNADDFKACTSRNMSLIGSLEPQYLIGGSKISEMMAKSASQIVKCSLSDILFTCVYHEGRTCIIMGTYLLTADKDSSELIRERQRVTAVWQENTGTIKLVHLHVSDPYEKVVDGEIFPHNMGKNTWAYLQRELKTEKNSLRKLKLRKNGGSIINISENEIECAEAKNHDTEITINCCTVTVQIQWREFLKLLGPDFRKVHRSFAINVHYISEMTAAGIKMKSGKMIPVPDKKRKEIFAELMDKM